MLANVLFKRYLTFEVTKLIRIILNFDYCRAVTKIVMLILSTVLHLTVFNPEISCLIKLSKKN